MSLDFIATSKKAGMNVLPGKLNKYALHHFTFKSRKLNIPESSCFVELSPFARKQLGLIKRIKYYEASRLLPLIESYQSNIKVGSLNLTLGEPDHRLVSIGAWFGISGVFFDMTLRTFKYHLNAYPKIALGIMTGCFLYQFSRQLAFRLQINNANRFMIGLWANSQNAKAAKQA